MTPSYLLGGALLTVFLAQSRSEASTAWPNEPAGYATLTDFAFDSFTAAGWRGRGTSIKDDATATAALSPTKVGEWTYPVGFTGDGVSPSIMAYDLPPGGFNKEGYVGYWWKPSSPWQGHPSYVNKISFIFGDIGHIILVMYGPPGGPYRLQVAPEWGDWHYLSANKGSGLVTLGQWHHVELQFIQRSTGGCDPLVAQFAAGRRVYGRRFSGD